MTIPILATVTRGLWIVLEYFRERRQKVRAVEARDQHSATVWDVAHIIEPVGMILGFTGIGRIQSANTLVLESIGLLMLLLGITIRWIAIHNLGIYFSGKVTIQNGHVLLRRGLYKHLRHPAYTGSLLAHIGLGMSFANWFSIVLSSIPYFIA